MAKTPLIGFRLLVNQPIQFFCDNKVSFDIGHNLL